jgi:hypothetical protein
MEDSHTSCIIFYPTHSIWSSFGIIKYKYFVLPCIKKYDQMYKYKEGIEMKIIEDDYIIL